MSTSNSEQLVEYSGQLYDFAEIPYRDFKNMKETKRSTVLNLSPTTTSFKCEPGSFQNEQSKLSFIEELCAIMILLFGIPGAIFSIPITTLIIGYFLSNFTLAVMILCCFIFPLHFYPIYFTEDFLYSWTSHLLLKYFSFRAIVNNDAYLTKRKIYIIVAPPHGVFPFGNILCLITFPYIFSFCIRGLGANSALQVPIMGQLLKLFGVVPASPSVASDLLDQGQSIGINTGGIAEIYEADQIDNEYILLKSRKGMIKLAFKHGAALVPTYFFGNTQSLSVWAGGGGTLKNWLKSLSRRIGVALVIFWGRWGLPIAKRNPILGVYGKPIPVTKKAKPSDKDIDDLLAILIQEEIKLFDQYKEAYGWKHKKLIVV